jgi:small-conductance mechanosensitive channel
MYSRPPIAILLALCLLYGVSMGQAKPPATDPSVASLPAQEDVLPPDVIATRKAAVKAEIDALQQSSLAKEELEQQLAPWQDMMRLLTTLEAARQRQVTFAAQLDSLPQALRQVAMQQKALEVHMPRHPPDMTEAWRDHIQVQIQAMQTEIQELQKQAAADEVRLAKIPKELEQHTIDRLHLEERLREARQHAPQSAEAPSLISDVAKLETQLQVQLTEIRALEAERQWLAQKGPLHDARLRVAQIRLTHLQRDLSTVQQALGESIEQKQDTLSRRIAELERELLAATEPLATLHLTVQLETAQIQAATQSYRQQQNQLSDSVLAQEQHNIQQKQDLDRLSALFEKYASGESGGQRLLLAFERLQREWQRYPDMSIKDIEARLHALSEQLFEVEEQLYESDRQATARMAALPKLDRDLSSVQRSAALTQLQKAFDEKKVALRAQQQVLTALVQDQSRLLSMHREYQRLLEDRYYSSLAKIFWLQDGERLSLGVLREMLIGARTTVLRLTQFVRNEGSRLRTRFSEQISLWILALILFVAIPIGGVTLRQRLQTMIRSCLAHCAARELPPGIWEVFLIVLRPAIWPAYIVLVAWSQVLFLPQSTSPVETAALVGGLQVGAIILWVVFLGRDLLRSNGWGQQFWGWRDEWCRFAQRITFAGCLAALILMVPRHILLTAPGDTAAVSGSLALARFFLLTFQGYMLVLLGIAGWRGSPLMEDLLTSSREREGLLWRVWSFIYLTALAVITAIMTFDILGYRYAARYIWARMLESLSVVLSWRLLVLLLLLRLLYSLIAYLTKRLHRPRASQQPSDTTFDHVFHIAYLIGNSLLIILAVGVILEIWGISVTWLISSPLGIDILRRTGIIVLTIGIAIALIQVSKVITDYVLQPKSGVRAPDPTRGRKFRTMIPLFQTLVQVGIVFVAILVTLEQLNVATGPILTGVGIFGLAVGFASQSLIKDVINGLFILFEDSLSVGDFVRLRDITGGVEKVTLRAVTIRDLEGNVHVMPNSTLDMITNLTKDFGRQVLDIGVSYREDVDAVMAILREVDEDIFRDPDFGWDMLEPLEILGVQDFADSAVVIRTRVKTRAGQQWRVAREFRRRIKKAFDAHGVEIPFPHRTLYWGIPKEGQQPLPISLDTPQSRLSENGASSQPNVEPAAPPKVED